LPERKCVGNETKSREAAVEVEQKRSEKHVGISILIVAWIVAAGEKRWGRDKGIMAVCNGQPSARRCSDTI
jgi:hypothetical protein